MIDAREMATKVILNAAYYSGASTLASPLLSGCGGILMLHRVTDMNWSPLGVNSNLTVTPAFLDAVLGDLRRRRIPLVSLDEMLEGVRNGRPRSVVAITADDAYLDNFTEALPVLEAHDAPFTLYVAPALVSGEVEPWWEVLEETVARRDLVYLPTPQGLVGVECADAEQKRSAFWRLKTYLTEEVAEEDQQQVLKRIVGPPGPGEEPPRRFVNWKEVRDLAAHRLVTIGAHTVHHYNLRRVSADTVLREMTDSARILEIETGERPRHFAYPYGFAAAVGAREVEIARKAGFASAVTTRHGVILPRHARHMHALPRISINGRYQRLRYVRTLLSGLTTPIANRGRRLVTV